LAFFALHVPVFALIALFNGTGPLLALGLTSAVLVGPALAYFGLKNPRTVSVVYGFTAMLMGGLLVHFGQGPMQIEMHFYFFALIAMLALFGNPVVILTAAVTVALHHLVLWFLLPSAVFNYQAPIWVVLVHAAFVVLESVAAVFIARSFFDNVIGLEKIVNARTRELDARHREMRLVLDNVDQALLNAGPRRGGGLAAVGHGRSVVRSLSRARAFRGLPAPGGAGRGGRVRHRLRAAAGRVPADVGQSGAAAVEDDRGCPPLQADIHPHHQRGRPGAVAGGDFRRHQRARARAAAGRAGGGHAHFRSHRV
jgi:hypothetical protein